MYDVDDTDFDVRFHDLCRLCATLDNVKIDLFSDEGKRRQLRKKIQSCLPFRIEENDGFPRSLCLKCVYNLESTYEFRHKCILANRNLEQHIHKKDLSAQSRKSDSNRLRKIRPEVSIFAIKSEIKPENIDNDLNELESNCIENDFDDGPNPYDYLKVDVKAEDNSPNILRSRSNSDDNKNQYSWNANKRWLPIEHKSSPADQLGDSTASSKSIDSTPDDNSLSRRKNNNPRKIARDIEEEFEAPPPARYRNVPQQARGHTVPVSTSSPLRVDDTRSNIDQKANTTAVVRSLPFDKSNESQTQSCLLCERSFTERTALSKHLSTVHGIEPHEVLSMTSSTQSFPRRRSDSTTVAAESMMEQETIIYCEVCRREFHDRASLWLHMVHAHREEASVSCGICLKICCDNITLIEHVNTAHSGDNAVVQRRYSCQVCGRQHDSRQKLLKHATLHNLIDNQGQTIQPEEMVLLNEAFAPRECGFCQRKFFNEEKLNQHIQNFHNDSNNSSSIMLPSASTSTSSPSVVYKCELCGSAHANRMDRWWHMYHAHNKDSRVVCDHEECNKIFVSQALRDEHRTRHHEAQGMYTNTCEVCGKLWESRTVFYKHMMNVHPKCLPSICGICMRIFGGVQEVREHVRRDHPPRDETSAIYCDVCARPYQERSKMLRHRRVHNITDNGPLANTAAAKQREDLQCSICPELIFETIADIGEHRRTVHQLFVCDLCPKFYNGNNHLWKHVSKQHKGDPNVTCNLCLRTSASRAHLERHKIKYHSDPVDRLIHRPPLDAPPEAHKCSLCGREFRIRSLLKKHLKSCKGVKTVTPKIQPVNGVFPCTKCSKVFEQQAVLTKHMKNSHVIYYCEVCETEPKVGFDSKTALHQHIRELHADDPELVCDMDGCRKVLRLKADLQKHKQEHVRGYFTYICDMCGDMFSNRKKLRKHLLTFHKSKVQYLCAVCVAILPSMDELVEHVHSNHRILLHQLYTCQICGKRYPGPSKLVDHTVRMHGEKYKPCRKCCQVFTDEAEYEQHVQNHPPEEEKPPSVVKKPPSEPRIRPKSSVGGGPLSQELAALGITSDSLSMDGEGGIKRSADEPLSPDDGAGKRLRKKYKCTSCKDTFRSILELKQHKLESHTSSDLLEQLQNVQQSLNSNRQQPPPLQPATSSPTTSSPTDPAAGDRWTDFKPVNCTICGRLWNSKKQLWQHSIRSHPFEAMHTCGICLLVCKNYYELWYHLDSQHSNAINEKSGRFSCYVCGHYHNSQTKLERHIVVHKNAPQRSEYRCQYCQNLYRSVVFYREHVRKHEAQTSVAADNAQKRDSSEFSGFAFNNTRRMSQNDRRAVEDDITEVDDEDVEDMVELDEDDMEEVDEESGSEENINATKNNAFRGYENDSCSKQLPQRAVVGPSRVSRQSTTFTPEMPPLRKIEDVSEEEMAAAAAANANPRLPHLTEMDDMEEVDLESDISCSSSVIENNDDDDTMLNGEQETNSRVQSRATVHSSRKPSSSSQQRFENQRPFRNSNGQERYRRSDER